MQKQNANIEVSQPGFGKSAGPADYVSPKTLNVLTVVFHKLQKEPFVDPKRSQLLAPSS